MRALVCLTFHYVDARLAWLRRSMECFARYDMPLRLIVLTNTTDSAELAAISAQAPKELRVECRSFGALAHPFDLAWAHKPIIAGEFLAGEETHFIYAEDDILIAPDAFAYWLEHRAPLARRGLIPGFVRVECQRASGRLFATDQFRPTQLDRLRMVRAGRWTLANMDNPYTGTFILDRPLAAEYVASRSFDRAGSLAVKPNWDIRERAAMGLAFEHVPRFFWSRLAVPFDRATRRVPDCAMVRHAPDNYANDPSSDLARVPADALFLPPSMMLFARERARAAARLVRPMLGIGPGT